MFKKILDKTKQEEIDKQKKLKEEEEIASKMSEKFIEEQIIPDFIPEEILNPKKTTTIIPKVVLEGTEEAKEDYIKILPENIGNRLLDMTSIHIKINGIEFYNKIYELDNLFFIQEIYKKKEKLFIKEYKLVNKHSSSPTLNFIVDFEGEDKIISATVIKKRKKSVFSDIPKETLNYVADLIHNNKASYKRALDMIKKSHPEIKTIQSKQHSAFRKFLITNGYVTDKNLIKAEYKQQSKQEHNKIKREVISEEVINTLLNNEEKLNNLIDILFDNTKFKEKILSLISKEI